MTAETLVADGEEIQLNDKRYGVQVEYNSDTKTFTFASGSTGENIAADGALGVSEEQKHQIFKLAAMQYLIQTGQ